MAKLCEACDAGSRQRLDASEVKIQDMVMLNRAPLYTIISREKER
jgi:hypothetical protein